ncbi:MAG TPA: hypothetical protein VM282_26520 [Acidimicrobiales bacterium]|nr:hypothetical protein [Acidimicrobiales bacterium]
MNTSPEGSDFTPDDAIVGPGDATVDDWFGQDVDREAEHAERALELAGGDETRAEEIFEEFRRLSRADEFDVPADERPV